LGASLQLARRGSFNVTVIERNPVVGGNAGSFELEGLRVDYGSHRLHPSCSAPILSDIRAMLGRDLLDRPRHGRIRLRGRWVHFPLKPWDLITHLPPGFLCGVLTDSIYKKGRNGASDTFASVLERGLGKTICRDFYFPYAQKIWGLAPAELDPEQARRRVSASSLRRIIGKVLSAAPGMKRQGFGRFFYPKHGYGQISEAYRHEAERLGAHVRLSTDVRSIRLEQGRVTGLCVEGSSGREWIPAQQVLSTIPLTRLAQLIDPVQPASVRIAADRLQYRAMILIYLVLGQDRFTEFDAHYFPGAEISITRLSEPKHYGLAELPGKTVLCAELPCSMSDAVWTASDEELSCRVIAGLARTGLPVRAPVLATAVKRLPHAYPLYARDYRAQFDVIDRWLGGIEGLLTLGRQGLFAHDNTHHTLAMAYSAVECLDDRGHLDRALWVKRRREFESHVVED
jgi:protoporphyrinogen oxidase